MKYSTIGSLCGFRALLPGLFCLLAFSLWADQAQALCQPQFEGPFQVNQDSSFYRPARLLPAGPGYIDEEYLISCEVSGTQYQTVLNVRRPEHAGTSRQRTVFVEPTHPGNLWPLLGTAQEYIELSGHIAVAVSSSMFSVEQLVKPANPSRYEALFIPEGEEVESLILAQVGAMIKSGALPEVKARSVILGGYSNTAARVRAYIERVHDTVRLADGSAVFDGYYPGQTAVGTLPGPVRDLEVPVIEVQGEREVVATLERNPAGLSYRRPDGSHYRLYEVPGMAHIDTSKPERYAFPPEQCGIEAPSEIPLGYIWANTMDLLVRWVELGEVPPQASRIRLEPDNHTIARDEYGNARGGYPLVHMQVPIARYLTVSENRPDYPEARCDMIGPQYMFSRDVLLRRYGNREAYAREFSSTLNQMIRDGWYLAPFASELRARAWGWAQQVF